MDTVIEVIAIIIICLAAFVYFRSLGNQAGILGHSMTE
jgi:hypothetical protein